MTAKHASHAKIAKRIIRQIERNGYFVKVFHADDTVEVHGLSHERDALPIARYNVGAGPNEEYRAALAMAEALGINS